MGWFLKFGFGSARDDVDAERVRERLHEQERRQRALDMRVASIDRALEVIRRQLEPDGGPSV